VSYLGGLPLDPAVRIACDQGVPVVLSDPDATVSKLLTKAVKFLLTALG